MKIGKKVFIFMLCCFMLSFFTGSPIYAEEKVSSGIYQLKNDIYHESETGMSISRGYLNEDMMMEVRDKEVIFTVQFSGAEYMENYRMKIDGEDVPVEIVEANGEDNTIRLRVITDKVQPDMAIRIYIEPMGRDVEFKIIPKLDTKILIEAIDEEPVVETIKEETTGEASKKENSKEEGIAEVVNDETGFVKKEKSEISKKSNVNENEVLGEKKNTFKIVFIIIIVIVVGGGIIIKKVKK